VLSPVRSFSPFRTAARGLEAQRIALGVATENVANATTTRTADGTPYQPKRALQTAPDGARQFEAVLRQANLPLRQTDARHIGGARWSRIRAAGEMGPTTEVVGEDRVRLEYDPDHPDANADGYVAYPDINVVDEMARMISANRVYEANLTSVKAAKEMIKRSLEI
jgi:flagellar basal-body rod protein FlgC